MVKMGVIFAHFQASGNICPDSDLLKMWVSVGAIDLAVRLRSLALIVTNLEICGFVYVQFAQFSGDFKFLNECVAADWVSGTVGACERDEIIQKMHEYYIMILIFSLLLPVWCRIQYQMNIAHRCVCGLAILNRLRKNQVHLCTVAFYLQGWRLFSLESESQAGELFLKGVETRDSLLLSRPRVGHSTSGCCLERSCVGRPTSARMGHRTWRRCSF